MDPELTANLTVAVATRAKKNRRAASERRSFEHAALRDQRRMRGQLNFCDRMEADAITKRALSHVTALRQNPINARFLDRVIEKYKPPVEVLGPKIVTHNSKLLYHGHDKKQHWAPLEYY
eukprot:TRINITY_DN72407_c0_g1_i1.p1 TRINITY_DN72407_c0_g1~~TRINITY_DN72407_c0_g1_i1.p1  ORF type:complete len:120 (+),score=22.52 TRINITY_DN72407_c0_g1_i1:94-453(+)